MEVDLNLASMSTADWRKLSDLLAKAASSRRLSHEYRILQEAAEVALTEAYRGMPE